MRNSIALTLLACLLVSCGKGGLQSGETKKINNKSKRAKVVTAKNKDKLIIGDPNDLTAQKLAELEDQVHGDSDVDKLPLPGETSKGTGLEISNEVNAGANIVSGGASVSGSARVVLDVIDNDKNEVLWTIPVNASYSSLTKDGKNYDRRIHFDLNVQKVLSPYFGVSGEFLGSWNNQSVINRKLYGGAGLNLDILGNLSTPGTRPHILTSFYLLGGQDQYSNNNTQGKARGSFRLELRDIYLTSPHKEDKAAIKLFGKLDYSPNISKFKDNSMSIETGLSVLSPSFFSGMRVGVTPSYKYTRTELNNGGPTEHMHTFNLAFTLEGPKVTVNR